MVSVTEICVSWELADFMVIKLFYLCMPHQAQCKKSIIHQLTTMLSTSKDVLFPSHNHLCWWPDTFTIAWVPARVIIKVSGHQYWWLPPGNRTFLEVGGMVLTWWIVDFLPRKCNIECISTNVNVHVYSPDIPMSSADCTVLPLEYTLLWSHLLWGELSIFSTSRPNHYNSACCISLGIHYYWLNSYSASCDNWCTTTLWNRIMTAQCEGMGEVGSARYALALLPPCPSIRVLSYNNCQRSTHSSRRAWQCKCYTYFIHDEKDWARLKTRQEPSPGRIIYKGTHSHTQSYSNMTEAAWNEFIWNFNT